MFKTILCSIPLALAFAMPAQAFPAIDSTPTAQASIILVSGGCGPYAHRGPYGGCRPGGQWGARGCPPGYHLGPYGQRCWRNRGPNGFLAR